MTDRVLLVGENNPYGSDPEFALYPWPRQSAGYRLCKLVLDLDVDDYLERFDRVNLLSRDRWSAPAARERAREILESGRRRVVACGAKVARAFGVPADPFERHAVGPAVVVVVPHPSGLSRAWNTPGAYERARDLVLALDVEGREPVLELASE